MKKFFLLSIINVLLIVSSFAQSVGIGTTTPHASSILEIKASNKGLLIPRTSTTSRTAIVNPAKGLMVYDTTSSSFWYQNGSAWVQIGTSGNSWSVTGNAGTDSIINFVGTTDARPLVFRVNNVRAGYIGYGKSNTSFGYNSFISNNSGDFNTASGTGALLGNMTGYNNTASGSYALTTNTAGSFNIAMGSDALHNNNNGNSNSALGYQALYFNTGDENTAAGRGALFTNTAGSQNTAIGTNALVLNTIGNGNTANGYFALFNNTKGYSNIAIGDHALFSNTDRGNLVAIGDSALYNNGIGAAFLSDASYNTAVGSKALYSNTSGHGNTANGSLALYSNTIASHNTATGNYALYKNVGEGNTADGYGTLAENTNGYYNVADGLQALESNTTGYLNTAVGCFADISNGTFSNATAIGANAIVSTSNTIQLGDANVISVNTFGAINAYGYKCKPGSAGAFRGNVFNIDWTPGGAAQLWIDVTNLGTISFTSDRRLKENIGLIKTNGIERMMALKPVHFMYKKIDGTIFSESSQEQEGFVADELQQVIPSAVNGEKDALTTKGTIQPQTINIVPVVAVLTKAVQEQQQIIETQKNNIDALKAQVAELTQTVNKLINK